MITVSENGFRAMTFSSDFESYAKSKGIRNPFKVRLRAFEDRWHNNEDGSSSMDIEFDENGKIKADPAEPSREERDAYIRMRDEYVARRCFEEIGYDMFLAHTKPKDYECNYDISYMKEQNEFIPCKSADGQCSFYCPQYWCCIRGIWTPD